MAASKSANLTIKILGEYSNAAIKRAEQDLRSMEIAAAKTSGGMTQSMANVGQSIMDTGSRMEYAGRKVEDLGTKMNKVSGVVAAAGIASAKLASDYENSVAKVYTIMDKSVMSTDKMSKDILDLSTATGKSATELAEATYQALSASVATEKAVPFVEQSVKLAKAGFTETTAAVDVLTTAINAYGMSADDAEMISNRLVQTQNKGKTTVNELAQNIGNVIPTAAAYNVSLDNLCAGYVQLTKQGINTANATTAINGMLTELADEGSTVAQILREKTGKSFGQLMADGKNLGEVIGILSESVGGNSEEFANLWGNVRASKGALAIANAGVEDFNKAMGDMANSTGLVDTALEDLQTPSAKASKALNALKNTGIELGEQILGAGVPSLEKLASGAQGLYKWFSSLSDGTKQMIVTIGGLVAAAGPFVTILGKGMQMAGGFVHTIGSGVQTIAAFGAKAKAAHADLVAANGGVATASTRFGALTQAVSGSTKAMTVLKGAVSAIGVMAVVTVLGEIIANFEKLRAQQETLAQATESLTSIMGEADRAYQSYNGSVESMTVVNEASVQSVRDAIQAQADLNAQIKSQYHDLGVASAEIDYYAGVIASLGDKGSLTAEEQFKLSHAVEQFNERTGASISVLDAQSGKLSENKDQILAMAEAWKEEAKTEALKSTYTKYLEQLTENTLNLEDAQKRLNEADEGWGIWFGDFGLICDDANWNYHQLQDSTNDLATANDDLKNKITMLEQIMGEQSSESLPNFDAALGSCGLSVKDLGDVSEETLNSMRGEFDGSLASVVTSCTTHGVKIPQALADAINTHKPTSTSAAQGMGSDISAGVAQGVDANAEKPKFSISTLASNLIGAFKGFLGIQSPSTVFAEAGMNIDEGLMNGINSSSGQPVEAIGALGQLVQDAISGLPSWMQDLGNAAGSLLAGGIDANSGNAQSAGNHLFASGQMGANPLIGALQSIGSQAGGVLVGALSAFTGSAGSAGSSLSNSAQSGANTVISALGSIGRQAGSSFASGVGSVNAYGQGQAVASSASNGMGSANAYNVGWNFSQGFSNGMYGPDIWSAAYNIGQSALGAIKWALGIASPSKEAMKVGEFFGQGAVLGMRSTEDAISAEAARMSAQMALEPPAIATGARVPGGGPFRQQLPAASQAPLMAVTLNVYMNDEAQAQQAGRTISETLQREWERYRRSKLI